MNRLTFLFAGLEDHDASVSTTSESLEICGSYDWSIIPESSGLDGSPLWTLEVSNDGVNFDPYDELIDNADILQGFDDTHSNFIYYRINYDAVDNTMGTVKFEIILKKK